MNINTIKVEVMDSDGSVIRMKLDNRIRRLGTFE